MRKAIILLFAFILIGCSSLAIGTVVLSKEEKTQAQSIAERRQKIIFARATAQNEFNAKMNRSAEEESALNIEAQKLCFELKKAHKLENKNYQLDEWNGLLIKQ